MKRVIKPLLLSAGLATCLVGAGNVLAQGGGFGGGNFDPAQFQQMMMDNIKERLQVTNDDEWKVMQPLVQKVLTAQQDARSGMRGMRGFGRRGGGGGGGAGGDAAPGGGGGGGRRGGFFGGGQELPEATALQQAVDAKASPDELKAKLAKLRDARKEKEAVLAKAQDDLRKVLTVRQEAESTLMGLLQ